MTLSLSDVLDLAIQIADTLHVLGQQRIVHKDIKPANILFDPATKQMKLINFSIASRLPRQTQTLLDPNLLEGTLAYLSPEQTGRMNRGIDYRSDFYSLGVTLYQLLTDKLPFDSDDPIELVYCHLARIAVPVCEVNKSVPVVVSQIVAKLMAKNAEDRYQSAIGLKYDLEQCLSQFQTLGTIAQFEIGGRDISDRFVIPERLYGRETAVKSLLDAFARVAAGSSEFILVAGCSGIGKTAVINELHKPITRQHEYFIKGKFDQYHRNMPLSAFLQAFRDLIGQLLSESDARLAEWKRKILAAVGENGGVLIAAIPELEQIIGAVAPAAELTGLAAQNRFNLLFQKFIEVFTTAEHPLTIFLDDLQWADSASLQSIELLLVGKGYLLILGAYRDNEVSSIHPLTLMLDKLNRSDKMVRSIALAPLTSDDLDRLVADTLHCATDNAKPLSALIATKTQGNPLFITQFLKALHEDGEIKFNSQSGGWECDISSVQALSVTDDVVEFMASQLQKLPIATQQVLKLAACIGNKFDLATLAIVSAQSQSTIAEALWEGLQSGAILPIHQLYQFDRDLPDLEDDVAGVNRVPLPHSHTHHTPPSSRTPPSPHTPLYRFLHDRVQQAAYSLIPESERSIAHYQIGRLLLQKTDRTEIESQIFELVNQLNYGIGSIDNWDERRQLAELNLLAGRKAKAANADRAAMAYIEIAIDLLGDDAWKYEYALSVTAHELSAEVAFRCGEFERMDRDIEIAIDRVRTVLEQVRFYIIKIQSRTFRQKYLEAIEIALLILDKLGINFPEHPTPNDCQQAIDGINNLIGESLDNRAIVRSISDIFHLPPMEDVETIATIDIAVNILPACHILNSPLCPLVTALQVQLSIEYGNSPASVVSYAVYACILVEFNQIEMAHQFGRLAYRIISETDAMSQIPETVVPLGLFIHHRQAHLQETLALFQIGELIGLEMGKLEYVGYCGYAFCLHSYWCGEPLAEIAIQSQIYQQKLREFDRAKNAAVCEIVWETALALMGNPDNIALAFTDPDLVDPVVSDDVSKLHVVIFYLHRAMYRYLVGELAGATTDIDRVKEYIQDMAGTISKANFYFYDSLLALANLSKSIDWHRVAENQAQLAEWAKYAPMNYLHKWQLVEAEKCRGLGQKSDAIELYDLAIAGAKTHGYIQDTALANELAAKFYLDWGKEKIAASYMQEAYYCYGRWGATTKTDNLERSYPLLLAPILAPPQTTLNSLLNLATINHSFSSGSVSSQTVNTFDLVSIIQSAQALSSTIELEDLIHQLSQIILKNSGAETCILVLPTADDEWLVRAISTINPVCEIVSTLAQTSTDNLNYPANLIYWVKNTQQVQILDARQPLAILDPYLLEHQPQSVFCLPISKKGTAIGVLYLEHRQAADIFTEHHKTVISFLCTQAAIALENARLYQTAQIATENLRIEQSYFTALLNNIPHIAWLKDEQCRFIAVNQPFSTAFGLDAIELVGKTDFDIAAIELAQKYRADDLRVMASGERQVIEEIIINDRGDPRWIETIKTPIRNSEGDIAGTVGIALDITDRKQAQIDLHLTNHRLELTNAELIHATNLKDEFLATMSHELRTPLNSILGLSEALQEEIFGSLNDRQLKSLRTIERSGRHLLSLINDILDLSKISAGKLELNISTTTILHLCHSSLAFVKQQAFNKQVQLDVQLPPTGGKIAIDERRMRQVLINLLGNAVKFTPPGGRISLSVTQHEGAGINFAVTDTGIGIDSADFDKLFQPFIQLDSHFNRQYEGTGLGLALVKQIVELHGGNVTLHSELNLGSCFTVQLPETCSIPDLDNTLLMPFDSLCSHADLSEDREIAQPFVILLAEDNEANLNTFSSYLNAKGYRTISTKNGREAISILEGCANDLVQRQPPDLILMDIQMPEMNGFEAMISIRQQPQLAHIPIVALTALAMEGDREKCLAAGANEYLTKPVKLKQLATTIEELLRVKA